MLHKHKQSYRHHSNQLKCVETLRCVFSAYRQVQLGVVGVLLITHSITLDQISDRRHIGGKQQLSQDRTLGHARAAGGKT